MALTCLTSCNGLGIAGLWNSEDELEDIPVSEDGERWGFLGRDHKVVNGHFSVREGKGYALYRFSGKRPEVKLGHGSETSYWILMHQGNGRYVGTWGKKCKPSEVTFTFS